MQQKLIEKNQSRCIYQINEGSLTFYLMIPNNSKTSLTLQITANNQVEDIIKFPIVMDKTIIVPIINPAYLEALKNNQVQAYNYLDEVISKILNLAHKILTYNHINVETAIFFNRTTEFPTFQDWFLNKYNPRIQIINIVTSIVSEKPAIVEPPQKSIDDIFSQIDSQVTSISSNPEQISSATASPQPVIPPQDPFAPNSESDVTQTPTKEPGFVSYILLGVLAAVVSLVFLYLII